MENHRSKHMLRFLEDFLTHNRAFNIMVTSEEVINVRTPKCITNNILKIFCGLTSDSLTNISQLLSVSHSRRTTFSSIILQHFIFLYSLSCNNETARRLL